MASDGAESSATRQGETAKASETDAGSKWTPQMAAVPNARDYRRKVKYNPLFRTFFWLVEDGKLIMK